MSSSIRSIKSIERSHTYSPVQSARPYAYYPYRDGETQQTSDYNRTWNLMFQQAANSAVSWLQEVKQAQDGIDQLTRKLSSELHTDKPIADSLYSLTKILNHLEARYKDHSDDLIPELWESIELALRHPAAEEIGLRRSSQDDKWMTDSKYSHNIRMTILETPYHTEQMQPDVPKRLQRMLLGSDGMLNGFKYSLTYAEEQKAVDLLQSPLISTLPYAAYHSSMQTYSPIPYVGMVLNRYL